MFGPSVLTQIYLEQRLADVHLALVDPDLETIDPLAAAGRRLAGEQGPATTITTHAGRAEALDGADFVLCSASPQMQRRFAMDSDIIDAHLPGHLKTEFAGAVFLTAYSLLSDFLAGKPLEYPCVEGREKWQTTTAGLNHFAWLVEFRDRSTDADLLPELRERFRAGDVSPNNPRQGGGAEGD